MQVTVIGWTGAPSYATRAACPKASPPLVAVLNGPNMNMLGLRQPHLYGSATLDDVEQLCAETADQLGLAIDFRQTNGEGELVSWVQECRGRAQGIVINPAGYTTTSIALMDALLATELPVIEVHVTNIHRREEFRQHSYVSKAAVGVICGLGVRGYALALTAMADILLEATHDPHSVRSRRDPRARRRAERDRPHRDRDRREGQPHPHRARRGACRRGGRAAGRGGGRRRTGHGPRRTRPAIPARCSARWSASPTYSPEPGAPPFVTVGQSVEAGQTLLLIEAMKTFNQIRAPKAGTVARILVANSTPVEYGEVLLILE